MKAESKWNDIFVDDESLTERTARKMSAAPELLDALIEAREFIKTRDHMTCLMIKIEKAISKATGVK